ncbi:unnamed protein product [Phytophthora fragariaefolia]|uniref:RxLR effector protein n=1 Tax=Phytophthora fragariaefolia TaxID=1490495 RepID=A0A9W6YBG6_9STRA|nr:unnamed protein product [Phytophthora fragariaefolia]
MPAKHNIASSVVTNVDTMRMQYPARSIPVNPSHCHTLGTSLLSLHKHKLILQFTRQIPPLGTQYSSSTMRLTYFIAVGITVILYASDTAQATMKNSNRATITNVATAEAIPSLDTTEGNGDRMLRKVKEHAAPMEAELGEERIVGEAFKKLMFHLKPLKRFIWKTDEYKLRQKFKHNANQAKIAERNRQNMEESIIH